MTKVNLDTSTWHNNDADDDDPGHYSYRGTTNGMVNGVRVVAEDDTYGWGYRGAETELKPPFYVVYATYFTGDTFGSDWDAAVVGVTETEEEAIALRDEAKAFEGFGSLSNGYYVPWNGYFESLENVRFERVP